MNSFTKLRTYNIRCTLTSFFDPKETKRDYVDAIVSAIVEVFLPAKITINHTLHQGYQTDTILLTSKYLKALATAFQKILDLPTSLIKGPPGPSFHVTLRGIVFDKDSKLKRIRNYEHEINLHASARWLVALNKKEAVTLIKDFPLMSPN